jgi:hypothetical protein
MRVALRDEGEGWPADVASEIPGDVIDDTPGNHMRVVFDSPVQTQVDTGDGWKLESYVGAWLKPRHERQTVGASGPVSCYVWLVGSPSNWGDSPVEESPDLWASCSVLAQQAHPADSALESVD